jgi:AAA+ ATPase superfamily predicted ATPase
MLSNRKKEVDLLTQRLNQGQGAHFCLVTGKRKTGKTTLVKEYLGRERGAYISIGSKSTSLQLSDISDYLKTFEFTEGEIFVPSFKTWKEFFEYLFYISREQRLQIVLDDFQNIEFIEPEIFDVLRKLYENKKSKSCLNLIVISSDFTFINKYFYDKESPLYQITDFTLKLAPFKLKDVIKLYLSCGSKLSPDEIARIYIIFGGMPYYYNIIRHFQLWNCNANELIKELVLSEYAPLRHELSEIVLHDFTRDNKVYFSILQAIAQNISNMSAISSAIDFPVTSIAKYLGVLEYKKKLIKRKLPLNEINKINSKYGKYYISSYFENFWFRFIQPDFNSFSLGKYKKMLAYINGTIDTYTLDRIYLLIREIINDPCNEKTIRKYFGTSFVRAGGLWNRKYNIEIAAEENNRLLLAKVLHKNEITLENFQQLFSVFKKFIPADESVECIKALFVTSETPYEIKEYAAEKEITIVQLQTFFADVFKSYVLPAAREKAKPRVIRQKV